MQVLSMVLGYSTSKSTSTTAEIKKYLIKIQVLSNVYLSTNVYVLCPMPDS